MRHLIRLAMGLSMMLGLSAATLAFSSAGNVASGAVTGSTASTNSAWSSCNKNAVASAPKVMWTRIEQVTKADGSIPSSFESNAGYRNSIVKIVCYESTYDYHAANASQYGWYQMSKSLMSSEGVSFTQYWSGSKSHAAGWYQCMAGELYIVDRYGNPSAAWKHEHVYGWY